MTAAVDGVGAGTAARERIAQAALAVFARDGFEGAGTREVALAAGVQQGLIGYHFGSKEGLWRAVVDAGFARLLAAHAARDTLGSHSAAPRERLRAELLGVLHVARTEPLWIRVVGHALLSAGPHARWLVERHLQPLRETLRERLVRASGRAANTDAQELALWGWFAAELALAPALHELGVELGSPQPTLPPCVLSVCGECDAGVTTGVGAWSIAAARRRAAAREGGAA